VRLVAGLTDEKPKYADDYHQPENDCISWPVAAGIEKD
jgi:hypothetical protein